MKKIGITGQSGFVGMHLYNTLGLMPEKYERIDFNKNYFEDKEKLDQFTSKCDIIVHLAAMNRNPNANLIYSNNLDLVEKMVASLERTNSQAHVLFSSSSQEANENLYGKSKKEGRELFVNWSGKSGGKFSGLIIPNVFGPFGKPNYNSFIATFCHKLTHGELPTIDHDSEVHLIYIGELVKEIITQIDHSETKEEYIVPYSTMVKVSVVLSKLENFKNLYFDFGEVPPLISDFDYQLFNTFRSYFDIATHYPIKLKQNIDSRGAFVEVIRLGIGGQCSFSTTFPGITRGNHFHTRKIERFAVIKGKALIQLRKIDSDEVVDLYLDGSDPSYVDMPIWYTHNIKNIGEDELLTFFWINEPYDAADADTYFMEV
jgi:UDP-2-acetamido-2,6-beta-L-arabino-hexul-4-ose reductase